MIWIIFLLLAGFVGLYLMHPFLAKGSLAATQQIDEAKAQRKAIEAEEAAGQITPDAAEQAKQALDRRILALLDEPQTDATSKLKSLSLYVVPAVFLLGGVGLYTQVGSPAYQSMTVAEFEAQQAAAIPETVEEFVVDLEARLANNPNPPAEAYVVLARGYLRLGEVLKGLQTYDKAVEVSDGSEDIIAERDEVIRMLRARIAAPQIDPEAAAAIQSMSPEDQAAMIQNMVEGLSVRLEQDPTDVEGWLRLIRSRVVLGDMDQAQQDYETALTVFDDGSREQAALTALSDELLSSPETGEAN